MRPPRRARWLGGTALLVGLAVFRLASYERGARVPHEAPPPAGVSATHPAPPSATEERASDGIFIAPAGSAPLPPGPHHPHPITAQHERIYRENNLIGALNGAVDVRDAAGLRRLLAEYREQYPEDEHALQTGYAIIAECLDNQGPAACAQAQRYYDEEIASNLRRYVRRICLE